jgi:hypothetical protein
MFHAASVPFKAVSMAVLTGLHAWVVLSTLSSRRLVFPLRVTVPVIAKLLHAVVPVLVGLAFQTQKSRTKIKAV